MLVLGASDWEVFVSVIAANILEEQTPKRLLDVRAQFYDLLVYVHGRRVRARLSSDT